MGRSIMICITILLVLTIFSIFVGNDFTGASMTVDTDTITFINGSSTTMGGGIETYTLGLSPLQGALAWIITLVTIICLAGLQVLASGLSDPAVKTLRMSLMYGGIWAVLSVLTWSLIISIPIFGGIIWLALTVIYAIGVFQKMGGN